MTQTNSQQDAIGKERNPRKANIYAGRVVANSIRTTLGPKGMDKLLVTSSGKTIITNDGATILKNMQLEHPIAQMIVEIATSQDETIGDGTTTAVIIAGELLKQADDLLDQGLHPTQIINGYNAALTKSIHLLNQISKPINTSDLNQLKKIANTAMTGKANSEKKDDLGNIIAQAAQESFKHKNSLTTKDIPLLISKSSGQQESQLLQGLRLNKNRCHPQMPKHIEVAKILTLNNALETNLPENNTRINLNNADDLEKIFQYEQVKIKQTIQTIIDSGANVIFCQKGIDETIQHALAKQGILAYRRLKKSELAMIASACNSKIINDLETLTEKDTGFAKEIIVKGTGENETITIITNNSSKFQTILLQSTTKQGDEELKRAVEDALGVVITALKNKKVIAGGGYCESYISYNLKKIPPILEGKEVLAYNSYARAIEIIPKTLAENCGLDALDTLTQLQTTNQQDTGIDMKTGKTKNTFEAGIIEPLESKIHALKTATAVTNMILRIDDVILMNNNETQE